MPPSPLTRVRKLCLALPETHEVMAWSESTFRIRNKMFVTYASADNHHGDGRPAIWCKASPENQQLMIDMRPDRYFVPPYVGKLGWIGAWVDKVADWKEIETIIEDAYRARAPKSVLKQLDG